MAGGPVVCTIWWIAPPLNVYGNIVWWKIRDFMRSVSTVTTILGGNRSGGRAHPFREGGKFHHKGGVFGPPFLVDAPTIYRDSVGLTSPKGSNTNNAWCVITNAF